MKKTKVISIGGWNFFENTHKQGCPCWAVYFGEKMATILPFNGNYKCIIENKDYFSEDSKVLQEEIKYSLIDAMEFCQSQVEHG